MSNLIQYRKYNPQAGARTIIAQANLIISEAEKDGWYSMTLRQLYYQFVSRGFIQNAVKEYKRLGRIITDARYGGLISWTAIEDAGRNSYHFPENPTALDVLKNIERKLTIDPWVNQSSYVEIWVEKQALESTIARPAQKLHTPYMACKGYLSASEAWRASLRFKSAIERGKRPILIHLGDHDPSGIDMTRDNNDRLAEFIGSAAIDVRRVALNMDQVELYCPPPNPAKEDDSRYPKYKTEFGEESWELDALKQNTIGDIITESVNSLIDFDKWNEDLLLQAKRREPLAKLASEWEEVEELLSREDAPLSRLSKYDDAMGMGHPETEQFLEWIASRLISVYGESENVDFVQSLRQRAKLLGEAHRGY